MDTLPAMSFASNMHMNQDWSPPSTSSSPPSPPLDESLDGSAAVTATTTTPNDALAQQHNPSTRSQVPNPMAAITNMLEDSSQLLVDYFALTEIDPATSMCDSDKHKLGKVVHILRQLARPAGSPAAAFPPYLSSSSSASAGSASSTRAANHQQLLSSSWFSSMHQQPQPVTAKRSSIPSWVIVPPGTVVPPGTPAIFATINTTTNPNNSSHSNHASSSPSSSSQQRTAWTPSQHALLLAEVAKYGCRFRHIYDLHGPNGTESRQLANFTVTQITAKWHRGLARMSAADAVEWTAKAARATEAFDAQRAAQASAVAFGKSSKLWTNEEFRHLCQQVAKHGTQFKRIWTEHGPEGTESQILARFTTTQLQAKWHNAKKQRPELENLLPAAPATADEVDDDGDGDDEDDGSSGLIVPNRWSSAEFSFLCEQIAKHGTQFKVISALHGANGTETQTLAKFTTTQLQSKWHNTKKVRPELESLVPNVCEPTQDDTDTDPSAFVPRNRWTDAEFHHLCEQIATHGTQFKLIHDLHGPNGEQSQTLARFTVTQLATKWHNAKKLKSEAELLASFPTSAMPKQPARTAKRSHGTRGMWSSDEIDFLFDQVVAHGGPSGLPKIWQLHGPEGTESRRLARFSLKQGRFKWYNELRGCHPRMPEIKRLLAANGVAGDGGEQGEREADDDMTDDEEENAQESREGEKDASPSKRPRLGDGEMTSGDAELGKSEEGDTSLE